MKKRLAKKDLEKINDLLSSPYEENWELATLLLKGASNLTSSFWTNIFNKACFSTKLERRKPFQKVLQELKPKLFYLGQDKFEYGYKSENDEGELRTDVAGLYAGLKIVMSHRSINKKVVFQYFKKNFTPYGKLPEAMTLLGMEYSFLSKEYTNSIIKIKLESPSMKLIPKELGLLPRLQRLTLRNTGIKKLSPRFKKLDTLATLSIENNPINEDNIAKGTFKLPMLENIYMNGCQLRGTDKFWEAITACRGLRFLNLDNNKLQQVPDIIRRLKKLEHLVIGENSTLSLDKIYMAILKLPNLKSLKMGKKSQFTEDFVDLVFKMKPDIDFGYVGPGGMAYGRTNPAKDNSKPLIFPKKKYDDEGLPGMHDPFWENDEFWD